MNDEKVNTQVCVSFHSYHSYFILVCVGVLSASCRLAVGLLSGTQIFLGNILLNDGNNSAFERIFVVELWAVEVNESCRLIFSADSFLSLLQSFSIYTFCGLLSEVIRGIKTQRQNQLSRQVLTFARIETVL